MSSYIVDDKTINRILAAAQLYGWHGSSATMPSAPRDIICPEPMFLDWALLGACLREMNVAAVVARYGPSDSLPGPCPLLPYEYKCMSAPAPIQTIKSLACYLYQCTEGAVPEQTLYQQLRNWKSALCEYYVDQSDAWNRADWG